MASQPDSPADPPQDERSEDELDALDLLEREDRRLADLLRDFADSRGAPGGDPGRLVEQRYDHGMAGKRLVREAAVREAARERVAEALESPGVDVAGRAELAAGLRADNEERRQLLDSLEKMVRGIQPMALNYGQDYDGAVEPVRRLLEAEIDWELGTAIPAVRAALSPEQRAELLPSASAVIKHSPTNVTPDGSAWWEGHGFLTRLHTMFDHLRDYPTVRSEDHL